MNRLDDLRNIAAMLPQIDGWTMATAVKIVDAAYAQKRPAMEVFYEIRNIYIMLPDNDTNSKGAWDEAITLFLDGYDPPE